MSGTQEAEVVKTSFSLTGHGATLTQITNALNDTVITIPSGKGGRLFAVSVSYETILETVLNAGGVIELDNTSADWKPFYIPTPVWTVVTEGGDALKPFVFHCNKKLPGNSTVNINYIPYDNQDQQLEITLHWILGEDPEMETFVDVVHPLQADEVSATTRAAVVTSWAHNGADVIPIPGHKGGTLKAVIIQPFTTMTTVVVGGGMLEIFVDSHDITPMEFYTTMISAVGASGSAAYNPQVIPHSHEVKANSNYSGMYTPRNALAQSVTFGIVWERPYETKR